MSEELNQSERWLVGELFRLGQQVSSYAVRMMGADIEQAGEPDTEEEFQMGSRLVELGTVMRARAAERAGGVGGTKDES